MESPHAKPRPNFPPPVNIPCNITHTPMSMPPDSAMLQTWVKDKLSIIPAMYSNYDEGMKAITQLIQQDFAPKYYSVTMQAFYKEFYSVGAGSAETGVELWSRWRRMQHKEFMNPHTSVNSNTTETSSTAQDKGAALDPLIGTSSSTDATMGWQLKNSLISEAEAKMLRNRDSNYWGDLATPVWPQSTGKVKVVYIRPRSSRTTVSPESQNNGIDSGALVGSSTRKYPRRNSLPATHSTLVGDFSTMRGFVRNNSESQRLQIPLGMISDTVDQKSKLATIKSTEKTPHTRIVPPGLKKSHINNSHISPTPNTIVEDFQNQPSRLVPRDDTLSIAAETFGMEVGINLDSSEDEMPGDPHNQAEQLPLDRYVTAGNSGAKTGRLQRTNRKIIDFPGFRKASLSLKENEAPVILKCDTDGFGVLWTNRGLPIQRVCQGQGTLGVHSPVESFVASSNMTSPADEGGRFYSHRNSPIGIARPPGYLSPIALPTRAPSPSSIYSSSTDDPHSGPEILNDAQANNTLPTFYQIPPKGNLGVYSNKGGISRPPLPRVPDTSHTRKPLWQEKPLPPLNQQKRSPHDQIVGKGAPVTQGNSGVDPLKITLEKETNRTPASPGAPQKLHSRFSFVLPPTRLGYRPAHITHRRNSMQPPGLRVTKEVTQEEEKDIGRFDRATFTTHVPRFGKDPMKQIHKAHSKGDTKRPAFLRVIQDAVHDGIHITKKIHMPSKAINSDVLKTPSNSPTKLVSKMCISGPIHNGNPLQLSSSKSTPNVLLNALPIPRTTLGGSFRCQKMLPGTTLLNSRGKSSAPQSELLPWDHTAMGEDGYLSDESEDMAHYRFKDTTTPSHNAAVDPAITIDPFQQAALYSWIECSVVQACSDFLKQQQTSLNLDLLRKEVKKWRNEEIKFATGEVKKRDQPIEFMFGMEVQCRLIEGSHKALVFSGPSAMNPTTIITSWKHIIPSFSPRTFCFPDYLVLEHLRIMEKVLHLLGPAYWDNKVYEKKRAETVKCIMDSGKVRKTRSEEENMERLQRERERAETQLLMEVGIWSTEESAEKTGEMK